MLLYTDQLALGDSLRETTLQRLWLHVEETHGAGCKEKMILSKHVCLLSAPEVLLLDCSLQVNP